jgi:hypothetical protein
MAAAAGAAPKAAGNTAAAWWRGASSRRRNTVAGTAVLLVILAVVGFALTLSAGADRVTAAPSRPSTAPSTLGPASSSPAPTPSATPAQSTTPPATTAPVAADAPRPRRAPPPAAPAVHLSAMVSMAGVVGFGSLAEVNFTVTNLGTATSTVLTAHLSVPPGVSMTYGTGLSDGWECSPGGHGAVCAHQPLTAGTSGTDTLTVLLTSASACGRPIELTVAGRFAHASAATPVRCGHRG